ncbi:MAG: cytochrome C oxidase subunit I [Bacteroidetes bacterium]|nr:cytochrome C oxidase subunit I [Bacteroidota bacterium]MBS1649537.1 cytochrome C oxidase subunit I [Bacteroidota bacterium]
MFITGINNTTTKTTTWKVVLPFYLYAALSFLAATILLFISSNKFLIHYFQPNTLAITHIMALGWGTMIILGASHQLVPVIVEGKLYSNILAYISFILAGIGIPLLVYSLYIFSFGATAKIGGSLILTALLAFVINLALSITQSKSQNIHATFVFTSTLWLFITAFLGVLLVFNFSSSVLSQDSVYYLPLHAHLGIIGWFLLLIIGVGSRLIPMFLISKYVNEKLLRIIYYLINISLLSFIVIFFIPAFNKYLFVCYTILFIGIMLFLYYCIQAHKQRIRKKVDEQMKISLLSVIMMLVPLLPLFIIIFLLTFSAQSNIHLLLLYGFLIFFGWITAIILGMTFKTLPFIVWNKVYHIQSANGKTPNPKDLFNNQLFIAMSICYLCGIFSFVLGILFALILLLQIGAALLIATAFLYNYNVAKILLHKPIKL